MLNVRLALPRATARYASFPHVLNSRVSPIPFQDPVSEHFWKDVWLQRSRDNTDLYEKVFNAVPTDKVTTWAEVWPGMPLGPSRDHSVG